MEVMKKAVAVPAVFLLWLSSAHAANPRNTSPPAGGSYHYVKVLQANVGNSALGCEGANWKLCYQTTENNIRDRIAQLAPDVVFLQEVLPDKICRAGAAGSSDKVCYNYSTRTDRARDQVRRLLPSGTYTTVCEGNDSWDCTGVRHSMFAVLNDGGGRSCAAGKFCVKTAAGSPSSCGTTAANRDAGCTNYIPVSNNSSYDAGFHIFYVDVSQHGHTIRLINGHPQSGGRGSGSKETARRDQVAQALGTWAPGRAYGLLGGDMNLDPYRENNDVSVIKWREYVDNYNSSGTRTINRTFWYHNGVAEGGASGTWWPKDTLHVVFSGDNSIDHVISKFMYGWCRTMNSTDSASPNYRLDKGSGMDHSAIWCSSLAYPY